MPHQPEKHVSIPSETFSPDVNTLKTGGEIFVVGALIVAVGTYIRNKILSNKGKDTTSQAPILMKNPQKIQEIVKTMILEMGNKIDELLPTLSNEQMGIIQNIAIQENIDLREIAIEWLVQKQIFELITQEAHLEQLENGKSFEVQNPNGFIAFTRSGSLFYGASTPHDTSTVKTVQRSLQYMQLSKRKNSGKKRELFIGYLIYPLSKGQKAETISIKLKRLSTSPLDQIFIIPERDAANLDEIIQAISSAFEETQT